jgi:hypothetical protein
MKAILRRLVRPARQCMNEWKKRQEKSSYAGFDVDSADFANDVIAKVLISGKPASIGKIGSAELDTMIDYLKDIHSESSEWMSQMHVLHLNAGIFPEDTGLVRTYCATFLRGLGNIDVLGVWFNTGEARVAREYCTNATFVNFLGLEPYYCKNPWTRSLEHKNVLVIHPFRDSIKAQYDRRELVWGEREILPGFNLLQIKMPLSDAVEPSKFANWQEQLDDIKRQMDALDYDVALVGAGAYSLLITEHAKLSGKVGIHLGGATQILFGIKGSRWENHPTISAFFNENWVKPSPEESPQAKALVENACYW